MLPGHSALREIIILYVLASFVTIPVKWDRLIPNFSRDACLSSDGVMLLIGWN